MQVPQSLYVSTVMLDKAVRSNGHRSFQSFSTCPAKTQETRFCYLGISNPAQILKCLLYFCTDSPGIIFWHRDSAWTARPILNKYLIVQGGHKHLFLLEITNHVSFAISLTANCPYFWYWNIFLTPGKNRHQTKQWIVLQVWQSRPQLCLNGLIIQNYSLTSKNHSKILLQHLLKGPVFRTSYQASYDFS